MMPTLHRCRECGAAVIDDYENGETVCSRCGLVNADNLPDVSPESIGMSPEERPRLVRASGQTLFSLHDLGISTKIDVGTRDFSGKPIRRNVLAQVSNLRRWQQRVRITSSRDRRISSILARISHICNVLSLSDNIVETAAMIYRNIDSRIDVRNKSQGAMASAVVYMACKQCDVIRSMVEIASTVYDRKEIVTKKKLAARYYRSLVLEIGSPRSSLMPTEKYISKIANVSETDPRVERLALNLAHKTKNYEILDGKDPNGIAAAYLYIASTLLGYNMMQRDISDAAGVSEVTIRHRCKEIMSMYAIRITLKATSH